MKLHFSADEEQMAFTATPGHAWARKKDPLVSIILRSFNEAWALADTLRGEPSSCAPSLLLSLKNHIVGKHLLHAGKTPLYAFEESRVKVGG